MSPSICAIQMSRYR